jgi:hypothetical protein
MKKFLKIVFIFFAVIGNLFWLALAALIIYLLIAKPFGIQIQNIPSAVMQSESGGSKATSSNPLLTSSQESMLQSLGVDTSKLPTSITPAQMTCFTSKLGAARVQEIAGGSSITAADYFKVQSCLK